jgi:hypothetical protein
VPLDCAHKATSYLCGQSERRLAYLFRYKKLGLNEAPLAVNDTSRSPEQARQDRIRSGRSGLLISGKAID